MLIIIIVRPHSPFASCCQKLTHTEEATPDFSYLKQFSIVWLSVRDRMEVAGADQTLARTQIMYAGIH